jgi:hypothetical protein
MCNRPTAKHLFYVPPNLAVWQAARHTAGQTGAVATDAKA